MDDSFGEALQKIRKARKATLREVSQYIGKSIGYISDIEHDRKRPPNLEIVGKIEEFLDVKNNKLLTMAKEIRNRHRAIDIIRNWIQRNQFYDGLENRRKKCRCYVESFGSYDCLSFDCEPYKYKYGPIRP